MKTPEELQQKQAEMPLSELLEKCHEQVSKLAQSYGKSHRMSIPPDINDTDMLLSEALRRLEELERKAWECSVEMMEESDRCMEDANNYRDRTYVSLSHTFRHAAEKIREAFGLPKSETPEKFKDVCPICNNRTVVNNVCTDCTNNLCKPFIGEF